MRRDDHLYKWLIVIKHNKYNVPWMGSQIFFHIMRVHEKPTAGCTSMSEDNILMLMQWLDKNKYPLLIQSPLPEYLKFRKKWNLPEIKL